MSIILNDFSEYDGKYKRIINSFKLDDVVFVGSSSTWNDTAYDKPLVYDELKNENIIYLNRDYYNDHKKEVDLLIEDTLRSTTKSTVALYDPEIITDEALQSIVENSEIRNVELSALKPLKKEQLELLLSGNKKKLKCSVDLLENGNLIYDYVPGLVITNYPSVAGVDINSFGTNNVVLTVEEELTSLQLEQLKKLFIKYPQEKIIIDFKTTRQLSFIISLVNAKEIKIKRRNTYTKEDYQYIEKNHNNVYFEVNDNLNVSATQLREKEEFIESIIKEVKANDLSPLEEYMYLYNVVKLFKDYKEVAPGEPLLYARDNIFTFFNEYIVCCGYSSFLEELVNKLDNPNISLTTYFCDILAKDGVKVGHNRCLVQIKDDKYQVDGVYISDPSWDHVNYYQKQLNDNGEIEVDINNPTADIDLYNHFLLTKEEINDENITYANPDLTDVLFKNVSAFSSSDITHYLYLDACDAIKKIRPDLKISPKMLNEKVIDFEQRPIESNVIMHAVKTLYSKIYYSSEDKLEELVEKTAYDNAIAQQKKFNITKNKYDAVISKKSY